LAAASGIGCESQLNEFSVGGIDAMAKARAIELISELANRRFCVCPSQGSIIRSK
jgi:hypothetical protein